MSGPFVRGDRVRLVNAKPAEGSKRRPTMPQDRELVVDQVRNAGLRGDYIGVRGYPGYWRADRFEAWIDG